MLLQSSIHTNSSSLTSMPALLIQPSTTTLESSQNQGQSHLQCMYLDNTSASSDESKASLFNQYFYSVFTAFYQEPDYVKLNLLVFNEEEVYAALVQLDPNKATGIAKISPKVLKHCASSLFCPLCHLFNLSLSTGAIPTEWKIHLITLIYKSADRSSVKNYCPISLLCIVSKVLETLIHSKLLSHIFNNITIRQFDFLPGRSHPTTLTISPKCLSSLFTWSTN